MKISAIIQARMGSTRLSGKSMKNICGRPLIWHVVNRIKYSQKIDEIIIATTTNPKDDILCKWAKDNNIKLYRGSENDVLNRYYKAAKRFSSEIIVRVTADDPFKDPKITDLVICEFEKKKVDFAYNNHPPSFPEGLDVEVFSFDALTRAESMSNDNYEREHVTQFFYRNPSMFKQINIKNSIDLSSLRWTIDEESDLEMARKIYTGLYKSGSIFLMDEIINYLKDNPKVAKINTGVKRSGMYNKRTKHL